MQDFSGLLMSHLWLGFFQICFLYNYISQLEGFRCWYGWAFSESLVQGISGKTENVLNKSVGNVPDLRPQICSVRAWSHPSALRSHCICDFASLTSCTTRRVCQHECAWDCSLFWEMQERIATRTRFRCGQVFSPQSINSLWYGIKFWIALSNAKSVHGLCPNPALMKTRTSALVHVVWDWWHLLLL